MHRGKSGYYDVVFDFNMARQLRKVGQYDAVAKLTVVTNVRAYHYLAIVADFRAGGRGRAGMDGREFAYAASFPDFKAGHAVRVLVLKILGHNAKNRERVYDAVVADFGFAVNNDVGYKFDPVAKYDIRADGAERSDFDIRAKLCIRMDD